MEGGPFLTDWWTQASTSFVPYLNVTANGGRGGETAFDGAPDQGLLREKGGRGFPYCVVMDPTGEVLWEVRPTTEAILRKGLSDATALHELRKRSADAPGDAGLAASAALLAELGKSQRGALPMEELVALRATKGLDEAVAERFDTWKTAREFDERVLSLLRQSLPEEETAAKMLEMYRKGVMPPEGAGRAASYWYFLFEGAFSADELEVARKAQAGFAALGEGNARMIETANEMLERLKTKG